MRDEHHDQDPWQGSLFAPESPAPPARAPGPTPDPFAGARAPAPRPAPPVPGDEVDASGVYTGDLDMPGAYTAAPADPFTSEDAVADPADMITPSDYVDDAVELEPAHAAPAAARSLLAGPTLDDTMSRAWEGLRAEVPTPCPVCHTEIEPSAGGRCGACGSTLD